MEIVWFKKDFRIEDHRPLFEALSRGPTLGLFVLEEAWLIQSDFSANHLAFCLESLEELQSKLLALGVPLVLAEGKVETVLHQIHHLSKGQWRLWSHQETGSWWTYQRDIQVKKNLITWRIPWAEFLQCGVFRGKLNRNLWAQKRQEWLNDPLISSPKPQIESHWQQSQKFADQVFLEQSAFTKFDIQERLGSLQGQKYYSPLRQKGGRSQALNLIKSFIEERKLCYSQSISRPLEASVFGSRLSPYLTWGCVSVKEVHQKVQGPAGFTNRLWWRCHFMQKLESAPRFELKGVNRVIEIKRRELFGKPNWQHFECWRQAKTGFPMLDASMKALQEWGWINFRMRAMLTSFACYQLKLPWREVGLELAKWFVDFEPGIHWSQILMQSGSTGINALRIYCPVKQGLDQDPTGAFIRKFIPELNDLALPDLFEPWSTPPFLKMSQSLHYPDPIVDLKSATLEAKTIMFSLMKETSVRQEAQKVYQNLGSRKHHAFPRQKRPFK